MLIHCLKGSFILHKHLQQNIFDTKHLLRESFCTPGIKTALKCKILPLAVKKQQRRARAEQRLKILRLQRKKRYRLLRQKERRRQKQTHQPLRRKRNRGLRKGRIRSPLSRIPIQKLRRKTLKHNPRTMKECREILQLLRRHQRITVRNCSSSLQLIREEALRCLRHS